MKIYRIVWSGSVALGLLLVPFAVLTVSLFIAATYVFLLALTSPPVAERVVRSLQSKPSFEVTGSEASPAVLSGWTDAELYAVWCSTFAVASRRPGAEQSATAAQARDYLLAEFERRHPTDLERWLKTGAGLSGEPPRFLLDDGGDRPDSSW